MVNVKSKALLFAVLIGLICTGLLPVSNVIAQTSENVKIIDNSRVIYNNKTYIIINGNPYGRFWTWIEAGKTLDDCGNYLEPRGGINKEPTSSGFVFKEQAKNATNGDCRVTKTTNVGVTDLDRFGIQAYRISEKKVFFPVGFKTKDCGGGDSQINAVDVGKTNNFSKAPTSDPGYRANKYFKEKSGSSDLDTSIWLETSSEFRGTVHTVNNCSGPFNATESFNVRIAGSSAINDDVKKAYGLTTGQDGRPDDGDSANTGTENDGDACDAQLTSPLSWILCPVIDILQLTVNRFFTAANDTLNFQIADNTTTSPVKNVWVSIRNLANILFVISFLIIIISQALVGKL